jgi:hypothetical protein
LLTTSTGTGILAEGGLLLLVAIIWGAVFTHELILFSAHPLLNSTAIFLSAQAILIVQPTHTAEQKKNGAVTHGLLNGTAALAFLAAFVIILYNKTSHHGIHFESPHAIMGLITYISIFSVTLFGTLMFYFPQLFGSITKAKSFYKFHRMFGYTALILQLVTVSLAVETDYNKNVLNIKLWTVILAGVIVILGVFPRIKKVKLGL